MLTFIFFLCLFIFFVIAQRYVKQNMQKDRHNYEHINTLRLSKIKR